MKEIRGLDAEICNSLIRFVSASAMKNPIEQLLKNVPCIFFSLTSKEEVEILYN